MFVNFDPDASWDPDDAFDSEWPNLANFPIEDWVIGQQWTKSLECNWKAFWDNFNECLHCPKFTACDEIAMERVLSETDGDAKNFGIPVTSIPIPQQARP